MISRKDAKAQRKTQRRLVRPLFASSFAPLRLCARFRQRNCVQFRSSLTLTHPTVTGMLIRAVQNHSATLKRWLGLLLVVFILYGTTIEAAHRHGRILPAGSSAASLAESQHTTTPAGSKTSCSDCLICQLHQNFTTTLIAVRVSDPPKRVTRRFTAAVPPDVVSQITATTAGRAPPSIS